MATRIIYKGRYVPDEIPTKVREIYQGNGMTQLTTVEPPKKEIECFQWDWGDPPKKNDRWVYNTIAIATLVGIVAILMIPIVPVISVITVSACLAWLGLVGYANR